MEMVSASEFVRHFGQWQDRAGREAIYIQHHGKPRYVLTSVELLQSMIDANSGSSNFDFARDALLDAIDSMVLIVDAQSAVTAMTVSARAWFGRADWRGAQLASLLPHALRSIVVTAADRVRTSGLAETLELGISPRGPGRVELAMLPFADGIAIVAHDRTALDQRIAAAALAEAAEEALALVERISVFRINLRGYVVDPPRSLATMTGLSAATLASVRLASLFEIGSRAHVTETIEQVIGDRVARSVEARLAVNRGDPVPVRVAVSAAALAVSIDSLAVAIDAFRGA